MQNSSLYYQTQNNLNESRLYHNYLTITTYNLSNNGTCDIIWLRQQYFFIPI